MKQQKLPERGKGKPHKRGGKNSEKRPSKSFRIPLNQKKFKTNEMWGWYGPPQSYHTKKGDSPQPRALAGKNILGKKCFGGKKNTV